LLTQPLTVTTIFLQSTACFGSFAIYLKTADNDVNYDNLNVFINDKLSQMCFSVAIFPYVYYAYFTIGNKIRIWPIGLRTVALYMT